MVFYKVKVFCSDIKWKMAATAGLSLTLEPMGTVSQNASSLKPLGQYFMILTYLLISTAHLRSSL